MTRLTRLSAAAQAHYVVLRSVPEISLIPFDKNIEKLFQIFSDGSRAYSTDISAFAVFTDQIHLLLTPREKAEDLSRFVQQLSRLYSHYFNDEFSRNGKIWQGRFESSLLQGKGRLLAATIYMEWLPFVYGYGEPQAICRYRLRRYAGYKCKDAPRYFRQLVRMRQNNAPFAQKHG